MANSFEFYRYRFPFRCLDPVYFPPGKSGNVIRGALGLALQQTAAPAEYARLFEPRAGDSNRSANAPSGFRDRPRPFVVRAAHLDGQTFAAGGQFHFDVHFFDVRNPGVESFTAAFEVWERSGLGPRHGRVRMEGGESPGLSSVDLDAAPGNADAGDTERLLVRFVTPTELKAEGQVVDRPEFGVLFARVRDRIASLCEHYGAGAPATDFRALGERATAVELVRLDIEWESVERRSSRTGQRHPIGGFTGEAEYAGAMAEFRPWLEAARWSGVGRQTVWGKGDVRSSFSHSGRRIDPL